MSKAPPAESFDYVEWLSHLIIENADSPNFTFGPLDQKRLARFVLAVMPLLRATEEWSTRPTNGELPQFDDYKLENAFDQLRRDMGEEK